MGCASLAAARHPSMAQSLSLPLGILLARSVRPRPWGHDPAIVRELHSSPVARDESSLDVWAPERWFFELRKARHADLDAAGM